MPITVVPAETTPLTSQLTSCPRVIAVVVIPIVDALPVIVPLLSEIVALKLVTEAVLIGPRI